MITSLGFILVRSLVFLEPTGEQEKQKRLLEMFLTSPLMRVRFGKCALHFLQCGNLAPLRTNLGPACAGVPYI